MGTCFAIVLLLGLIVYVLLTWLKRSLQTFTDHRNQNSDCRSLWAEHRQPAVTSSAKIGKQLVLPHHVCQITESSEHADNGGDGIKKSQDDIQCLAKSSQWPVELDLTKWVARRASEVHVTGAALTATGKLLVDEDEDGAAEGWMEAVVPGTVLATLVHNHKLPEPFIGLNIDKVPDIFHAGRDYYTFWFSTAFATPTGFDPSSGAEAWLYLGGINYSAKVFLNGEEVLLANPCGMFLRRWLPIGRLLRATGSGDNVLAVLVAPPEHVGCVDGGGQGGDHAIAQDMAAQYVEGWDWQMPVADRNTGIWDAVSLHFTGPACLRHAHTVTVPARCGGEPENSNGSIAAGADWLLQTSVELFSASSRDAVQGTLQATVLDPFGATVLQWEEAVHVPPGQAGSLHRLQTQYLASPQLWWPRGMGEQPLYELQLSLRVGDYGQSDELRQRFGVRELGSVVDGQLGGHVFRANGRRVFVRGGNFIVPDALLRCPPSRWAAEARLLAGAGLNMVRLWGGAACTRPAFYDACDELGLLVWQEFWITGDCNGRGATPASPISDPAWPRDHALFLACVADTVKMVRGHACVALYCGGNEQVPAPDLDAALRRMLPGRPLGDDLAEPAPGVGHVAESEVALDSSRPYVSGSLWSGFASGDGQFSDGPYGVQDPAAFFSPDFYPYAFNPEVGSAGIPVAESMRVAFPSPNHQLPPTFLPIAGSNDVQEVPSEAWARHCFMGYGGGQEGGPANQVALYGTPTTLEEYCDAAQIANFVQYRALFEGWGSQMWRKYSGMLLWKAQNPWPGLRGQLYDWLLEQTGGYFGVQAACEPLHIQLNLLTRQVEIVNTTAQAYAGLRPEAVIYGLGDKEGPLALGPPLRLRAGELHVDPESTHECTMLEALPWRAPISFVFLYLRDRLGRLQSRNVYWLAPPGADFRPLRQWADWYTIRIQASPVEASWEGLTCRARVALSNPQPAVVAFWVRLQVMLPDAGAPPLSNFAAPRKALLQAVPGGDRATTPAPNCGYKRVLPVHYSANYLVLAPGESLSVELEFSVGSAAEARAGAWLFLRGMNTEMMQLPIPKPPRE